MDREKFLAGARAKAAKLQPLQIDGFDEPVYLKQMTMADVKAELLRPDQPDEIKARLKADQFVMERSMARLLRDESGALLFDPDDDAQMEELRAVFDELPPGIPRKIQEAQAALSAPAKEVDAKGN